MRISCHDAARSASDLIDEELPFGPRLKMRAHLLICRNCRTYVGQLRHTIDLVDAAVSRAHRAPGTLAQTLSKIAAAHVQQGTSSVLPSRGDQ
jgi:hypothetical protein